MPSVQESNVWFITGANRGIGLELTKQLLGSPSNIILATCRTPSKAAELNAMEKNADGRLHILALDITNREAVRDIAQRITSILAPEQGIDYLINNAGINVREWDSPSTVDPDVMQRVFETNVIAPAYIAQVLLPLVERGARRTVVNVSSTLGSLGTDYGTRSTSYAISKAALNMVTYKQQKERPDIIFISICPGWLRTDMGGDEAPNDVSVGVEGVLKTIYGLTLADSGNFFNFKGEIVPW
ncbi:NAD-P-binding protein [Trametes elegans]|nr:NAD-P-binding protein [Trametes elegans]